MQEVTKLIEQLSREKFFGALTIKFESGKVVILRKEETIKPPPFTYSDIGAMNDTSRTK